MHRTHRHEGWGRRGGGPWQQGESERGRGRRGSGGWERGEAEYGRGRRGGRRPRGDVRAACLALLAERPMHGYEIISELESRTGGVWRPSPGSVYPTLQLLADEGLVEGSEGGGKRLFTLTEAGRTAQEEAAAQPGASTPWEQVTAQVGPSELRAREVVGQLVMATRQVMAAGSEDQRRRALDILAESRRKIYAILAEEPE